MLRWRRRNISILVLSAPYHQRNPSPKGNEELKFIIWSLSYTGCRWSPALKFPKVPDFRDNVPLLDNCAASFAYWPVVVALCTALFDRNWILNIKSNRWGNQHNEERSLSLYSGLPRARLEVSQMHGTSVSPVYENELTKKRQSKKSGINFIHPDKRNPLHHRPTDRAVLRNNTASARTGSGFKSRMI